ncbi:MAG: hypothetical protein IPI55_00415 [Flavobacteriales bacterium]|nr:hypothetical protein [Flavobacteriales bacterium]
MNCTRMRHLVDRCADEVVRWMHKVVATPLVRWILSTPLRATLVLSVFTVLSNFPLYDLAYAQGSTGPNWPPFFEQVEAPFRDHTQAYSDWSHASKLGFRFVPAVICKALGLRTLPPVWAFQLLTLFALHAFLFALLLRWSGSIKKAFIAAVPCCLVTAGHPYLDDIWGYFDTLALAFLMAGMLTRRPTLSILFFLLAWFTDERALVASPALVLFHSATFTKAAGNGNGRISYALRNSWSLFLAFGLYALLRIALGHWLGLRTAPVETTYLMDQWPTALAALGRGCEGLLLVLAVFVAVLWRSRSFGLLLAYGAGFCLVWGTAIAVIDVDRSMAYLLPYFTLALVVLIDRTESQRLYPLLLLTVVLNLFLGASWSLPAQVYRMIFIDHTLSLF